MGSDHEAEIRASVGAHHDLGSGYDDVVAEDLVERVGAEIGKRIEAHLRQYGVLCGPPVPPVGVSGASASPGPTEPEEPAAPQGCAAPAGCLPAGYLPAGYLPAGYPPAGYLPGSYTPGAYLPGAYLPGAYEGYPGYPGPMLAPGYQAPVLRAHPTSRPAGQRSVAMTVIALGSLTLGVAATAMVAHSGCDGQAVWSC